MYRNTLRIIVPEQRPSLMPGERLTSLKWILLVLLASWQYAQADGNRLPDRFSVQFDLYSRGIAVAETQWSVEPADKNSFVYESRTEAVGVYAMFRDDHIVERSVWQYAGSSLRPLAYRYLRTGGKKNRDVSVAFDWQQNLAHNTANGETWKMRIPAGTLDKLNYMLVLMNDLAAGQKEFEYLVADGGKLKDYRLEWLGNEVIETPIGTLETVKLQRVREGSKRETYFWCAPAFAFLPVKMEHREKDGAVITMNIRRVSGLGPSPATGS